MKPRYETILARVLNDPYPGEAIAEILEERYQKGDPRRAKLEARLKLELERARRLRVPLGNNLGECATPEDAYLLRQKYISSLCDNVEQAALFRNILIMLAVAIAAIIASWLAV